MKKVLLTAGCSFSEPGSEWGNTWPDYLAKHYKHHIGLGKGGVGNGYISRAVIYGVYQNQPDVVAIMWSSWDRIDLRIENPDVSHITGAKETYNKKQGADWPKYPVHWTDLDPKIQSEIEQEIPRLKRYLQDPYYYVRRGFTENKYWTNIRNMLDSKQYAKAYFTLFEDELSKQIYSLEHILRTKWFLDSKNIPYVMMGMDDNALNFTNTEETQHLIAQLAGILSPSMVSYCMKNWGTDSFFDDHPTTLQHKKYTEQIILPYMESKCLI